MRKLTHSEVVARFVARDLEVLEDYQGSQIQILARCFVCKYERRVYPHSVFVGCRCPNCAGQVRLTQFEVAARFDAVGFELLDTYINNDIAVLVRCKKCRHEKRIKPNFNNGYGCPKCLRQLPLTEAEALTRFANKNLEALEPYKNTRTKILVRCIKCKHQRMVRPNHVFQGLKCPRCAEYGFHMDRPGILYYLRVANPFGEPVYKIGITNRTLRERFSKDLIRIEIIETWHFANGAEAFEMEQDILNDYDPDRYTGPDLLKSGNDELFNLDVLGLDKGRGQLELVA